MNKSIVITSIKDSPREWATKDKETGEEKILYYWSIQTDQVGEWEIMTFNNKNPYVKLGIPIDVTYKEGKKACIITKIGAGGRPAKSRGNYQKSPEEQERISKQICAEVAINAYKGMIEDKNQAFEYVSELTEHLNIWLAAASPNQNEGFMASNALRRALDLYVQFATEVYSPEDASKWLIYHAKGWLNYYHGEKTFYQSVANKRNSGSRSPREAVVPEKTIPHQNQEGYTRV